MGDKIKDLPLDLNFTPSTSDVTIISTLFKKTEGEDVKKGSYEFKDSVIGGVLFLVLSFPMTSSIIKK